MNKTTVAIVGNLNVDLVCQGVNSLPSWGEEKTCEALFNRAAGSAGYAALALGRLGLGPVVIGNVGDDDRGRMILYALSEAGADARNVCVSDSPTGVSIAMVNSRGERAFVTHRGHLDLLDADRALLGLDSVPGLCFMLLAGYFLLPSLRPAGARRILQASRQRGATTLLDTGWDPGGWSPEVVQEVRGLLRDVDVFLPNRDEAVAVAGTSDLHSVTDCLLGLGPHTVIIKCGDQGSLLASRAEGVVVQSAYGVSVIDTTGAGDSFNAGVLFGLVHGWDPRKTLQFASGVAALTVSRSEPRFPTLSDVIGFLQREDPGAWTLLPGRDVDSVRQTQR